MAIRVIRQETGHHQSARSALHFCLGTEQERPLQNHQSWWQATIDYCAGQDQLAIESFQDYLRTTAAKRSVIRAIYPENLQLASLAVTHFGRDSSSYFWLGDGYLALDEPLNGIASYEQGLSLSPDNANIWWVVANIYEEIHRPEKALHAFDQSCLYEDRGKNGCIAAGKIYLENGNYEQAAERFSQSLNQVPGFTPSRMGLANALIGLGRINEAQLILEAVANEGHADAQNLLIELDKGQ